MNKEINEILTDIRKESKLSRKGMQELSGFKASTIESYERGTRKPSKEYIEFISLYFGYRVDYINGLVDIETIKEYNKSKFDKKLSTGVRTILIYQSIYNYDDEKMGTTLNDVMIKYNHPFGIDIKSTIIEKYKQLLTNVIETYRVDIALDIAEILNIKVCYLSEFHSFYDEVEYLLEYEDSSQNSKIENISNKVEIEKRVTLSNKNGIDITPEYYASIIKKRNEPKDNYTPKDEAKEIPPKHKEILDLLPYAPDNFIDTIIEKLKTIKDSQVF